MDGVGMSKNEDGFPKMAGTLKSNVVRVKGGRNSSEDLADPSSNIITLTVGSPTTKITTKMPKEELTSAEVNSDDDNHLNSGKMRVAIPTHLDREMGS